MNPRGVLAFMEYPDHWPACPCPSCGSSVVSTTLPWCCPACGTLDPNKDLTDWGSARSSAPGLTPQKNNSPVEEGPKDRP
jgi:endogenous inhibitor of DNA gyrase (YacG/DUF329 family)